jgi:transposase InsO family protein
MSGIAWTARRFLQILKRHGLSPVPVRPTSWQTFLRRTGERSPGPDFFTTEVWTWRGLVTFHTAFVIDFASRRAQIVGSTPHPNEFFMRQVGRTLTETRGLLSNHRVLICDRDRKWSGDVRRLLGDAGVHVVQAPFQAPNANAYAERVVRSIKHERFNRMAPLGATFDRPSRHSSDSQLCRDRGQRPVSRPQFESSDECRPQEMHVDPPHASAV